MLGPKKQHGTPYTAFGERISQRGSVYLARALRTTFIMTFPH